MQNLYSERSGIDFSQSKDRTRQEGKADADVNTILARYGVGGQPLRQTVYGETNYDMDLQRTMAAVDAAKSAWQQMPANLREKYPSWQDLLNGLESGALRLDMANLPPAPKSVPPTPPA